MCGFPGPALGDGVVALQRCVGRGAGVQKRSTPKANHALQQGDPRLAQLLLDVPKPALRLPGIRRPTGRLSDLSRLNTESKRRFRVRIDVLASKAQQSI
jgi:hypothetical protein